MLPGVAEIIAARASGGLKYQDGLGMVKTDSHVSSLLFVVVVCYILLVVFRGFFLISISPQVALHFALDPKVDPNAPIVAHFAFATARSKEGGWNSSEAERTETSLFCGHFLRFFFVPFLFVFGFFCLEVFRTHFDKCLFLGMFLVNPFKVFFFFKKRHLLRDS